MSTDRFAKLPKSVLGKCRWCGGEAKPPRRYWCGDACVEAYMIAGNAEHARRAVAKRDEGFCSGCGLDTRHMTEQLRRLVIAEYQAWQGVGSLPMWGGFVRLANFPERMPRYHAICEQYQIPVHKREAIVFKASCVSSYGVIKRPSLDSLWEADHIVPVVEGGGACGLEGLRTLCYRCHAYETARLAARRARERRCGGFQAIADQLLDEEGL